MEKRVPPGKAKEGIRTEKEKTYKFLTFSGNAVHIGEEKRLLCVALSRLQSLKHCHCLMNSEFPSPVAKAAESPNQSRPQFPERAHEFREVDPQCTNSAFTVRSSVNDTFPYHFLSPPTYSLIFPYSRVVPGRGLQRCPGMTGQLEREIFCLPHRDPNSGLLREVPVV